MTLRIGIDVGGTFTDLVAMDPAGRITMAKSPTTPRDQSIGVLAGLGELAQRLGLTLPEMLARCGQIVHGTTVATNALLERKGAKLALLTTRGHRDIIEMHEGLKPERYNLRMPPPDPLVPRDLRFAVTERLTHDGSVAIPLDEGDVLAAIAQMKAAGVEAVAVCYLHAWRNPAHEQRTAALLAQHFPQAYTSTSSDVLPQIKEYERFSTTVVNSYVGPVLKTYLDRLADRLSGAGYGGEVFIILSHGGIARLADAARLPAATVLSGPAGGIVGARECARMAGLDNVLPFDMGGTSTEISLIAQGEMALTSERGVAGERVALRSFDILSIGAGGGSLAGIDASGRFSVGPQSAGAQPGPACYGLGGTEPTVSDANLVLGYLSADTFRGGRARLDLPAAQRAMAGLGARLGTDPVAAAEGIFRLINVKMADGLRLMTLRRGVDPRQFTLLSFGGAAGLHATAVARELGVRRVIVPNTASVLSAWGMLASDLRHEVTRSQPCETAALPDAALAGMFHDLEQKAIAGCGFAAGGGGALRIGRSAEMRYGDQIFEIDVALDGLDPAMPGFVRAVEARFHARHEALFTYADPAQSVEIVTLRVSVSAGASEGAGRMAPVPDAGPTVPTGLRQARLGGGDCAVPVYDLAGLRPGQSIAGPALIDSENTTVLLAGSDSARVLGDAWIDIAVGAAP